MENTNLNVNPYYDDFSEDSNFHRVLFRPGYAVQARELTQLQTILQNQIERHGRFVFKEGTVVIPGALGFTTDYYAVKIQSTFSNNDISDYISEYVGTKITGTTSGVVADVISVEPATTTDEITLFVKYKESGTDNVTSRFVDGENISSNASVGGFGIGIDSATLVTTNATATGSSANIEEGVYFIRGHFVKVLKQRIILDKYTNTPSYRVGLLITETLETPEEDTTLLDNAQGSSNLNAKGAHRLKISLTLAKLGLSDENDENFVELLRLKNGVVQEKSRTTEFSILEETLARRTYEQNGDFIVKPFDVQIRECLNDGFNNGVYQEGDITESGNVASEDFLTFQVSPGKAYVRGYEVESIAPKFIDVRKPRSTDSYNGAITPVEVGNYVVVNNVYSAPEISPYISGSIDEPYRVIELYDTQNTTPGASNGTKIGYARSRAFENIIPSGTNVFDSDATFKLYLFDIRMFTRLTLNGTPANGIVQGAKITGITSKATGFVTSDSSGTNVVLTTVTGNFLVGESIKSTSATTADEILDDGATDLTIQSINISDFSSVKQVYMPNGNTIDFTADVVLQNSFNLTGFVTNSGTTINGFQTIFSTELRTGDVVSFPSGASGALEERVVTVVSDTELTIPTVLSNTVTSVTATRKRSQLVDQNKNLLLRKLLKKSIKTLKTENNSGVSDNTVTIRRSFVGQTNSTAGELAFTVGSNETFDAVDNINYSLVILSPGTGSGVAGQIVNLNDVSVQNNSNSLTITSAAIFGNGASVRLIATVTRTIVEEKTKNRNRMTMVLVDNDGITHAAEYGTSAHHKEISLGYADVLKVHAIYDSEDAGTDPVLPQWTLASSTSVFIKGEIITGQTSGAKGRIINPSGNITFIPLNTISFSSGETIKGGESQVTAVLDTFTAGSKDITNRYVLDTGQRDNYYDIGRIVRKSDSVEPIGRLLVVFDYFSHIGSGDFFTVDSYSTIDYKDIPTYTATRVDPEVREPTGEYDLRDTVDFRPRVADATFSSPTVKVQNQDAHKVTGMSFNFQDRKFFGDGVSVINIPKDNSNFGYDFEYYLGRIDSFTITPTGEFKVIQGTPSENPAPPKMAEGGLKLAENNVAPFMVNVKDAITNKEVKKKYTAADLGKLESRISNIEYYTALNLLEKDAQSFEIIDENGLNRFKSGFLVDNFTGHSVGDVLHPDYNVSIDMENRELRPKFYMKGISLLEENTTDAERSNDFYRKTGDLITLPYEDVVTVQQPFATRVENLNPVLNFSWNGVCKLSPSGDEWFEVNLLPDLIVNREGNFDTVFAQNRNAIGTVWNSWQTQWSGQIQRTNNTQWSGRQLIQRTVTTETGVSTRSGIQTSVVAQIDEQSLGERVISQALIPFIRSRNVTFNVTGMKPRTRVYPFFDRTNIAAHVTPSGGNAGDALITGASGSLQGTFLIPDPNVRGNPQFRTGERLFRLTSDANNGETNVETFAQAIYSATGILNTVQETIIATRNARVEVRDVSQTTNSTRQTVQQRTIAWRDPIAQSFTVNTDGGEYITKLDVFFSQKDDDIPVTCQIREMVNGYPVLNVLPFGSTTLESSQVSVSEDASAATTFTFDSPVYLKEGIEYCIVLLTNSDKYLVWISRMGEQEVSGTRLVSEQPYLGVLFKSQNNSTWSAYDFEDLKFTLYRASFNTSATANVVFHNDDLPVKTLDENPIRTFAGSNIVKIYHQNHHMYHTSNNVQISGVTSDDGVNLNGIPLTEINATHSSISNIEIDSYTITVATNATASGLSGGSSVTATENALMDQVQTLFPVIEHPETSISLKMASTSGTSPDGNQVPFLKDATINAKSITINENYYFTNPRMICSELNETNELSGSKSLDLIFTMETTVDNLSPIIDTDRKTLVAVTNRLNNVLTDADIYPSEEFITANDPEGDSLETVYVTKKVQLKTPALAIRVILSAVQLASSNIEVMYKTLRSDDASDFDEIGWTYFNTNGDPDTFVNSSTTNDDFLEREYTVNNLEEFIAFAIKIRMRGTNSCEVPRIKDLRAIALAT